MLARHYVLIVISIFIVLSGIIFADTIYMKDGRKFEGEIVEDTDEYIKVKMKYGTIKVDKRDIEKIEKGKSVREIYEEKAAELKDDDAEGHFKLALWCEENKLYNEMNQHLEHVILVEPDHTEAREMLGYEFIDGEWMKLNELEPVVDNEQDEDADDPEEKKEQDAGPPPPPVMELLKKLREGTPEERIEALIYLSESPSSLAIQQLLEMLQSERDETVRIVLKGTIRKFPSSRIAPKLLKIACAGEEPAATDSVEILEDIGDTNACKALAAIYLGTPGEIGQRAKLALWRNKEKAIPVISLTITSGKKTHRLEMIRLAGHMREPRFVPTLMKYIHADKETDYKKPAIEAIKKIGEPAVPHLINFLNDPKRRAWANYLLEKITNLNINIGRTHEWQAWWKENRERVIKQQKEWEEKTQKLLDEGMLPPN